MSAPRDVHALAKLREAATAGLWEHNPINGVHTPTGTCIATTHRGHNREADAALIVAAVNALPDLIAAVRERDALREAVEKLIAFYDRHEYSTLNVDDLRAVVAAVDGEQ